MKVVHFHRRRRPTGNYSIEGFYENVRKELKDKIEVSLLINATVVSDVESNFSEIFDEL